VASSAAAGAELGPLARSGSSGYASETMPHAHEVLDQWGFGPGEPPLPGRVAARLGEVLQRLRSALEREDLAAARRVLGELESLHMALELWKSVELDHATLEKDVPAPSEQTEDAK
jgi:hypothetical protein